MKCFLDVEDLWCIESIHKLKLTSKKYWVMRVKHKGTATIAVLLKYVKVTPTCTCGIVGLQAFNAV